MSIKPGIKSVSLASMTRALISGRSLLIAAITSPLRRMSASLMMLKAPGPKLGSMVRISAASRIRICGEAAADCNHMEPSRTAHVALKAKLKLFLHYRLLNIGDLSLLSCDGRSPTHFYKCNICAANANPATLVPSTLPKPRLPVCAIERVQVSGCPIPGI